MKPCYRRGRGAPEVGAVYAGEGSQAQARELCTRALKGARLDLSTLGLVEALAKSLRALKGAAGASALMGTWTRRLEEALGTANEDHRVLLKRRLKRWRAPAPSQRSRAESD